MQFDQIKYYVNGEYILPTAGRTSDILNPATGEVIGRAAECDKGDVDAAIEAAYKAQKEWRQLPAVSRGEYLKKIAALLKENKDYIGRILSSEQGKTLNQATSEVFYAGDLLEYHAEWARRIEGEIVQADSANENIFIYKEPLGVVGCILPWNFPIYVLARKMGPALITGNTVVLKPSEETPLSTLALGELFSRAGLPAGVANIVSGDGAVAGHSISAHPRVSFVTLTGSVATGQKIMQACSQNITRVSLELGGKAPAVVMADANLELAADAIVASRLSNAGQVCNCVERVYVQATIADAFQKILTEKMADKKPDDGIKNPDADMGPLINSAAAKKVHAMVEQAISGGATLLTGGEAPAENSAFYKPTVLSGCNNSMSIVQQEVFGPVIPLVTFDTREQALELANDSDYGLTSVLFTEDYRTVMYFSNHIEAGELYVNRAPGEAYQGFHAGHKKSGIGGDDGKHGVEAYLKTRAVYLNYG